MLPPIFSLVRHVNLFGVPGRILLCGTLGLLFAAFCPHCRIGHKVRQIAGGGTVFWHHPRHWSFSSHIIRQFACDWDKCWQNKTSRQQDHPICGKMEPQRYPNEPQEDLVEVLRVVRARPGVLWNICMTFWHLVRENDAGSSGNFPCRLEMTSNHPRIAVA